jgi:glycosyltransferase involved in cell wall biosynthesis
MDQKHKTRLVILATDGISKLSPGFEAAIVPIINELHGSHSLSLFLSERINLPSETKASLKGFVRCKSFRSGFLAFIQSSFCLLRGVLKADILLVHGITAAWLFPGIQLLTRKKIVLRLHGMEWRNESLSMLTKWYLFWAEKIAIQYSHLDITDNESVQDYTAAHYGSLSRIVETGASELLASPDPEFIRTQYKLEPGTYAYLELSSEANCKLELVLEAMQTESSISLVIATSAYVSNQTKLRIPAHIKLIEASEQSLNQLKMQAACYLFANASPMTDPMLVQAMMLGIPIAVYGVSYNRTATEQKASYFSTAGELQAFFDHLNLPETKASAALLKEIAIKRYTWKIISLKYRNVIMESLHSKKKGQVVPKTAGLQYDKLLSLGLAHLNNPS